jgi:hypothetical protein
MKVDFPHPDGELERDVRYGTVVAVEDGDVAHVEDRFRAVRVVGLAGR